MQPGLFSTDFVALGPGIYFREGGDPEKYISLLVDISYLLYLNSYVHFSITGFSMHLT